MLHLDTIYSRLLYTLKNIPNILTSVRIALIPIFVVVFYLPINTAHLIAALIFALACFTDWCDGYLARRLQQTTKLGAFLDPVADKLIIVIALILIIRLPYLHYLAVPAMVIIGREIVVSALREWMAQIGQRTHVAVITIAKWKTFSQMLAIFCLLAYHPSGNLIIFVTGYITLYVAVLLTFWTMCIYLYAARKTFSESTNEEHDYAE